MSKKTIGDIRERMRLLQVEAAALMDRRKMEIGALAERAGAMELPDDVILGAFSLAVSGEAEAARFRAASADRRNRRGQRSGTHKSTPRAVPADTSARAAQGRKVAESGAHLGE